MKREIYEVIAKVVDASGSYNNLTGYPKSFDSHQNNDNLEKAEAKAYAAFSDAESAGWTAKATGRPLTIVSLIRVSDGATIEARCIGKMPELPDPKYVVTVTNGTGSGQYEAGANVIINADEPAEGKKFASWNGAESLTFIAGDINAANAVFVMPTETVTLEATYEDISELI